MKSRNWIRLTALLCALCLMLAALAGCGSQSASVPEESAASAESVAPEVPETPAAPQAPEALEESDEAAEAPEESQEPEEPEVIDDGFVYPVEDPNAALTLWYSYPPFFPNFYDTADEFPCWVYSQEKTGIDIIFDECTFMNAQENLTLMIASGTYTDMFFNMSNYVNTNLEYAVNEQIVQDLSPYIRDNMPHYSAVFYGDDSYVKRATTDEGYVPAIYQLNDAAANEGINKSGPVIRSDWLEKTGLDLPQTFDEYHEVLVAFQEFCEHPFWLPYTGGYLGAMFAGGFGVTAEVGSGSAFIQKDGQVIFCPTQDGFKEYLTLMNQWYNEGLIDPDFTSYNQNANAPTNDQIVNEEIGVWSSAANLMDFTNLGNPNVVVVASTNPVKEKGQTTVFGDKTGVLGAELTVTTACSDLKLALRWADWWYTEDGYNTTNYGIEGVSFEFDENGNARYTDLILNPEGDMTVNIAQSLYTCGNGMLLGVQDPTRSYQWYTPDKVEAERLWATVDKGTGSMPPLSLTAEESEAFSSRFADISTYMQEMVPRFIMGAEPLTSWGDFVANIQAMGIDECIAVEQAALDRYNSR